MNAVQEFNMKSNGQVSFDMAGLQDPTINFAPAQKNEGANPMDLSMDMGLGLLFGGLGLPMTSFGVNALTTAVDAADERGYQMGMKQEQQGIAAQTNRVSMEVQQAHSSKVTQMHAFDLTSAKGKKFDMTPPVMKTLPSHQIVVNPTPAAPRNYMAPGLRAA